MVRMPLRRPCAARAGGRGRVADPSGGPNRRPAGEPALRRPPGRLPSAETRSEAPVGAVDRPPARLTLGVPPHRSWAQRKALALAPRRESEPRGRGSAWHRLTVFGSTLLERRGEAPNSES